MLKNMTIGKKLALGFGVVLVLLALVGALSFRGVGGMGADAKDVIAKNELVNNLARREIDHLNWANQVVALFTDDNITKLEVQTDDHKCAFGQWLYSDAREHAEKEIPQLAGLLKEIEGCHRELHESAVEIGTQFRRADAELPGVLAARMVDHLKWADTIRDAFLENKTSLEVQTDPTQCALGKWLAGAHAQKAYASADAELKRAWDDMLIAHKKLHESAVDICQQIGQGEQGRAQAKKVFDEKTVPLLQETLHDLELMKASADQAVAGMNAAKQVFTAKTKPSLHKVQELLGKASEQVHAVVTETNDGMMASAQSTKITVTVLSVVAVLVGIIGAILIAYGIISTLKRIIASLGEGAEQVAAASSQVSAASQSLAEGATEQAAGLEETSSSLEEMSSMTKQNADNAQQANTLATEAKKAAGTGAEAMGRMNAAIQEIQRSSDETAKIIKVIDEIAFQTNLLALNAAVEAARAGEAGKGFAVVAEEVRNLAMRSAEAAKNTASMIEEAVKNSKNGVDIANEVGKVLEEIVQSVGKTTDLVSEIAAASQEQAQGIDQVNTAVAQMDKVTQQNAANAEESASASEELSAQAESMKEVVSQLVTLVGGAARHDGAEKTGRLVKPKLLHSDHVFHKIAEERPRNGRAQPVKSTGVRANLLGDDEELRPFTT
jgi:methyl-accepting chemotaxis protein